MKDSYDQAHKPVLFKVDQKVLLKLWKGYTIPESISKKLAAQRTGPSKIVQVDGRLAYKINVPCHWRMHPMVPVAQLEPAPKAPDLYQRGPTESGSVCTISYRAGT